MTNKKPSVSWGRAFIESARLPFPGWPELTKDEIEWLEAELESEQARRFEKALAALSDRELSELVAWMNQKPRK